MKMLIVRIESEEQFLQFKEIVDKKMNFPDTVWETAKSSVCTDETEKRNNAIVLEVGKIWPVNADLPIYNQPTGFSKVITLDTLEQEIRTLLAA